jgi:hypothetical protein
MMTRAERREVYDQGMERLKTARIEQDEAVGQLLIQLFEAKPSRNLIPHARKWLAAFPYADSSAELLGHWLRAFPSQEVVDLAARYLQNATAKSRMRVLVPTIILDADARRLHRVLRDTIERIPTNKYWDMVLAPGPRGPKRWDRMAQRWLELNLDNPSHWFALVVLCARSQRTTELIFEWLRRHQDGNDWFIAITTSNLLETTRRYNQRFFPKVVRFARRWLRTHKGEDSCYLHRDLLRMQHSRIDLVRAKEWYLANRKDPKSEMVRRAMLRRGAHYER